MEFVRPRQASETVSTGVFFDPNRPVFCRLSLCTVLPGFYGIKWYIAHFANGPFHRTLQRKPLLGAEIHTSSFYSGHPFTDGADPMRMLLASS